MPIEKGRSEIRDATATEMIFVLACVGGCTALVRLSNSQATYLAQRR
jgi:hypothetical protein